MPDLLAGATLASRLRARLFAGRLDREAEVGLVPLPGSSLAVHLARLASAEERHTLAHELRHLLTDLHPERLAACRGVIDDITLLLHSPRPMRARGMARLRILLSDGTGPLYRNGRGSPAAALRGVLAAL
ncbi:hypothetical protein ACTXG7_15025 [Mycolicibacterium sp. Dal123E01]|uniref:hypothetical protein n=1 Tax=Mycolicibacterium sp. Dal123E01 TaxID=3457578 RepID=UPI00403E8E7B